MMEKMEKAMAWTLDSWRNCPALQQPEYENPQKLATVIAG